MKLNYKIRCEGCACLSELGNGKTYCNEYEKECEEVDESECDERVEKEDDED